MVTLGVPSVKRKGVSTLLALEKRLGTGSATYTPTTLFQPVVMLRSEGTQSQGAGPPGVEKEKGWCQIGIQTAANCF